MPRVMQLSLSRFAQASAAALIALVLSGAARADIVRTFDVSGEAENVAVEGLGPSCEIGAECKFSGTMMVDVTASEEHPFGTVTAYDIAFPGLAPFDNCCSLQTPSPFQPVWETDSRNNVDQSLGLDFTTTTHIPGSLVGFDGGSILGSHVSAESHDLYDDLSGSITPAQAVPEPSSLTMLCVSFLGWVGFVLVRRSTKAAVM